MEKQIVSKGNGRNYYGYGFAEDVIEILKVRGCFYVAKFKHNKLTPVGDALLKGTFTLIEN